MKKLFSRGNFLRKSFSKKIRSIFKVATMKINMIPYKSLGQRPLQVLIKRCSALQLHGSACGIDCASHQSNYRLKRESRGARTWLIGNRFVQLAATNSTHGGHHNTRTILEEKPLLQSVTRTESLMFEHRVEVHEEPCE